MGKSRRTWKPRVQPPGKGRFHSNLQWTMSTLHVAVECPPVIPAPASGGDAGWGPAASPLYVSPLRQQLRDRKSERSASAEAGSGGMFLAYGSGVPPALAEGRVIDALPH